MAVLDALAGRLGVPTDQLAAFAAYDEEQLAIIDGVVGDALESEDVAFTKAVEESLAFLPRLIRPIAKKVLLGG